MNWPAILIIVLVILMLFAAWRSRELLRGVLWFSFSKYGDKKKVPKWLPKIIKPGFK
jgi:hypothetical protein